IACSEWKVPFLPVKPWQITFVFLSMRMDMKLQLRVAAMHAYLVRSDCLDDLLRGVVEIVGGSDIEIGGGDDLLAALDICAFQADHQRHAQPDFAHGSDDALRD